MRRENKGGGRGAGAEPRVGEVHEFQFKIESHVPIFTQNWGYLSTFCVPEIMS